jgi:acetoin utilization deacetylase AcuC-like enzyme
MTEFVLVHHPSAEAHDPGLLVPDHPDTPDRVTRCRQALAGAERAGTIDPLRWVAAPAAGDAELRLVHTAEHVRRISALAEAGGGLVDDDTVVGPATMNAARHAAGGACALVRELAGAGGRGVRGMCLTRPAGHHAEPGQAMGFCLFNNVAIAAETAIARYGIERVMIVDWDVHYGNGTAEVFRRRDDVLVAGIHQQGLYPGGGGLTDSGSGPGRGFTVNVPVPGGSDEEVWLSVLEYVIVAIGLRFRPQLVLISAGYDAHEADPLGGCRLESASFGRLACHVRDLADAVGAPVGAVLEGGYAPAALGESVVATVAALQGAGEADSIAPEPLVTPRAIGQFASMWEL